MMPGSGLVRRGADTDADKKLPKGIVSRVWRDVARPYRAKLAQLVLAITVASVLLVLPARLIEPIVNALSSRGPDASSIVLRYGLALIAVAFAAAGASLWQRWLSSWIGEELIYDLRARLYDHVQRMPLAFFTRTQTGALISRLNNDVIGAQRALTGTFGTQAANVVQVVAAVGFMFAIDWRLTLLTLSVLPAFVALAKNVGRKLQKLTRESMQLNADMNTVMTERFNVAGAQLVKLFGRPTEERENFADSAKQVADIGVRSALVGRMFFVTLSLVGALGTAVVYLVGGRFVLAGQLEAGGVVAFAALVTQAYQPLAALANAPVEVLTALVSFDRVFEILDLRHPIADRHDAVELTQPTGEIVFDDVTFAYPTAAESSLASLEKGWAELLDTRPGPVVLRGISFVAEPGQTIALVGPSGAGKSTITSLVPRLYDVSSGAIRLDGHDIRDLTMASLSAAIGVVSQDPHLFHDTVRANLRYVKPDATDEDVVAACRAAQIHTVIDSLRDGYDTIVGERGYRLSGGEKQRLSIARVLLKNPAVIILDEATAHLDSENEVLVQAALATALAGRTSLVIAHRLSTIVNADMILVVQGGRIVQRGTHEQLIRAEGTYAELSRTQFSRT
jgi:ATP-binding cassette subfamily B protein